MTQSGFTSSLSTLYRLSRNKFRQSHSFPELTNINGDKPVASPKMQPSHKIRISHLELGKHSSYSLHCYSERRLGKKVISTQGPFGHEGLPNSGMEKCMLSSRSQPIFQIKL